MSGRRPRPARAASTEAGSDLSVGRAWPPSLILLAFGVAFTVLTAVPAARTSATWDEPTHLTAGYLALTRGDFRVDPAHPPLLRMWAALPLLFARPGPVSTEAIDATPPADWIPGAYGFAHRFVYVENQADRMLGMARSMISVLGVVLGVLLFWWTWDWLGLIPAAVVAALFALEPNLVAHSSLATTDLGVTVFAFGAVYALWRVCRRATVLNVSATACCCALAMASKFSAVLLFPIVALLLALAVARRAIGWRAAGAVVVAVAVASLAVIWAAYGFRYLPAAGPTWAFDFATSDLAGRAPGLASIVAWVDRHHLLPNAYTQGFFYAQVSSQQLPSFLAGEYSTTGWWYYFPVALLLKAPLALVALSALGLAACLVRRVPPAGSATRPGRGILSALPWLHRAPGRAERGTSAATSRGVRREDPGVSTVAFIAVPVVVWLGVAMWTGINIGVRHVLPVFPFALLAAAAGAHALLADGTRLGRIAVGVLLATGGAELAWAYPYPLTFFNAVAGGPNNGFRYLSDSNLGWGESLKPLKAWMAQRGVSHVNLAYYGQADPAYYGIDCTHLPGAPGFAVDAIARPRLPGYVAISSTILNGVYSPPEWRLFYAPFAALAPAAVIGHSLRVYWVDTWPAASDDASDLAAQRTLAEALWRGLEWPEQAVLHYREYLRRRPHDASVLLDLGVALVAAGQTGEALSALHEAVYADPEHGLARLTLARALFGSRDLQGAATHAERAALLLPSDPDAHDFVGRVRAAQGRFEEALAAFRRALQLDPGHAEARDHSRRLTGGP